MSEGDLMVSEKRLAFLQREAAHWTPPPPMPPQLCSCETCTLWRVNRGHSISAEAEQRHASKVATARAAMERAASTTQGGKQT